MGTLVYDLSGEWTCNTDMGTSVVRLPGTLDENGIGHADRVAAPWHPDARRNDALIDANVIATRFTRKHTHEGPAVFSRKLRIAVPAGKRVFIEVERARKLSLRINGAEVKPFEPPTLSAPVVFEVTGCLTGDDVIELTGDNRYPDWPREDIVTSSAATDETQTNWNGLLGFLRLRIEERAFIHALRAYPRGDSLDVCIEVSSDGPWDGEIAVTSDALRSPTAIHGNGGTGVTAVWLRGLLLRDDVRRWNEYEGNLYALDARLGDSVRSIRFGVRDLAARDGHLTLNGRRFFLRGDTNCAVFPETGHPPTDVESWREVLSTYRSCGVNCVRFHSHCPPEAAFIAADELGMLTQPELSHWNPRNAFSTPESRAYYRAELDAILKALANHPSFVMLTLGNELFMDAEAHAYAAKLLDHARAVDPTRLYAEGSNNHYGQRGVSPASDFYTSVCFYDKDLRATSSPMAGWLNERPANACIDYDAAVDAIRETSDVPVISFEVGQYEVLPDFDELDSFKGVCVPDNLKLIRQKVTDLGLLSRWKAYVEATGELALICYRAEVEAALRTEGMSGISLLSLQDFPGQGTALVGMLNSHLTPKPFPFARPERFSAFYTCTLPLALLPRFTYTAGDALDCPLKMANYGKSDLRGAAEWTLTGRGFDARGTLEAVDIPRGGLTDLGRLHVPLDTIEQPTVLTLAITACGHENRYPIWAYPDEIPICPSSVHECRALDETAVEVLSAGGTVFLAPDATETALPHSVRGQFSTDFWSVGTFPAQPGGMGLLIYAKHPLFERFPTESHTNYQWWPMAGRRAVVLPDALQHIQPVVTMMDSYAYLRPMAMLFECHCLNGRLLFSSMGLHDLVEYPEARALRAAIYAYMASECFDPAETASVEALRALLS